MKLDDVKIALEAGEISLHEVLDLVLRLLQSRRLTDVAVESAETAADLAEEVKLAATPKAGSAP